MEKKGAHEATATELVDGILGDLQTLVRQHVSLLRQDLQEEIQQAKAALVSAGVGTGLIALGGILATHMAVHLVHRTGRLPLWASYGLVGGLLGGAGFAFLARARKQAEGVNLGVPPETMATIAEDLTWLKGEKPA